MQGQLGLNLQATGSLFPDPESGALVALAFGLADTPPPSADAILPGLVALGLPGGPPGRTDAVVLRMEWQRRHAARRGRRFLLGRPDRTPATVPQTPESTTADTDDEQCRAALGLPPRRPEVGPALEEHAAEPGDKAIEDPADEDGHPADEDGHPADEDGHRADEDRPPIVVPDEELFKELFAEEIAAAEAPAGASTDSLDPSADRTNLRSRCYLDFISELLATDLIQGLPYPSRWPAARAHWSALKGNDLKALKALNEAILKAKEEPIRELPRDLDGESLRAHVETLVIDLRAKVRAKGGAKPGCPRCRYNKKGCPPSCINRRLKGRKTQPAKAKAKAKAEAEATAEAGSECEASSDLE